MAKLTPDSRNKLLVVLVIIVTLFIGLFDYPNWYNKSIDAINSKYNTKFSHFWNVPFHLGLDLQGGTQLTYEADTSKIKAGEMDSSVEGVRDVIERRINALGVAEPVIQTNKSGDKYRVIVELAGIKDVNEAISKIGETPLLEFKEQNTDAQRDLNDAEKKEMAAKNKEEKATADKALAEALKTDDFDSIIKKYSTPTKTAPLDVSATNAEGAQVSINSDNTAIKYVSEASAEKEIYAAAKITAQGTVYNKVVQDATSYNIVKVIEQKDMGKQVKANHLLICWSGADKCTTSFTKEEAKAKIDELKAKATTDNFVQLVKENSNEPGAAESGGDLGWFGTGQMIKEFEDVAFSMPKGTISDVVETSFGYHLIYKTDEKNITGYGVKVATIHITQKSDILPPQEEWKNTGLSGQHLVNASIEFDRTTNAPHVAIEFNDEGKALFAQITERLTGQRLAIFLDGSPLSIPTVNEPIKEGKAIITGDFTVNEAKLLAQRLKAGALPVPITLVSQQTVGATLGQESVNQSLFAGLIGLALVAVFMIGFYRFKGFLAAIALIIYGILLLFIFKTIPITLTLSGIAGFILSMGMAVDANVLIFERIREEVATGKSLNAALDEGFKRAWPSIRDGNYSTLISCVVLFWLSSSSIKGFALTLTVGVLVSMFTAIVITRLLLKVSISTRVKNIKWLFFE